MWLVMFSQEPSSRFFLIFHYYFVKMRVDVGVDIVSLEMIAIRMDLAFFLQHVISFWLAG